MLKKFFILILVAISLSAAASDYKPETLDPTYEHDKWQTKPVDIRREFRAFTVSFDSADDDNKSGTPDVWGVPEWVSYEIKRYSGECIPTADRPKPWITDKELAKAGLAPDDKSYAVSAYDKKNYADYDRGHLCMKLIAERLGNAAAYNTHTMLNAVPQWAKFNQGIWLDLEKLTAAWAQHYGRVWVITGPIFAEKSPHHFIGDKNELPVAVPDALFKIVIKEGSNGVPDVLAFIYPQVGPGYLGKDYDHTKFLTSVAEIEAFTGLQFLTTLSKEDQKKVKGQIASALWKSEKSDFIPACEKEE